MNLFGVLKRQLVTPPEVIQVACNMYGTTPECVPALQARKLKALSNNIWIVKLDEQNSAVVAYGPEEREPVAAPWYVE